MSQADRSIPVAVTGASGYIAGWIVRFLLEEGYTVHATVRDPNKPASVGHLTDMAQNLPGQLKLFAADLLASGSFDDAVRDCSVVMHTASPFVTSGFKDPNEALVRPAVEGTRNVLQSCMRSESVRRVVLTSSCASIYGDNRDTLQVADGIFTEAQWNTSSSLDHNPYQYSKVEAEKEAWKLADSQDAWELVTINPSLVMGPSLTTASQSTSISTLVDMGNGKMRTGVPKLVFGLVDVRDVARAHLLAGFTPGANGRNIVSATEDSMLGMARILSAEFPKYPFPKMEAPKFLAWMFAPLSGVTRQFIRDNVGYPLRFDNRKGREELGIEYRALSETLKDHFQQLIDDGLVKAR